MLGYIRTDDDKYLLTIDGVVIASPAAEVATSYFRDLSVDLWTPELCEHIILLSAEEILNDSLDYVRFHQSFFWKNDFESFSIDWISVSHNGNSNFQLAIWFTFDVNNWKQPWSMYEYMEEFKLVFDRQDFTNAKCCWLEKDGDTIHVRDGYSISFDIKEPFAPIEIEIERALSILNEVHKQAIYNLSSMAYSNAVTVQFNFPEEVKSACKQYLMYFTQFLHDVGIDATDELKEQADSVLFSVTPRNQEEALEHIKIALEIYLRLPSNPTVNSSGYLGADIEVQRLVANIHHLQGQLALASAIIQQKDLLIQQQQTIIKSGEVLIQSIQECEKSGKKEDKEPLLGKVLSVKKLELWKTLELDVPTLLRYLKQYFKNEK